MDMSECVVKVRDAQSINSVVNKLNAYMVTLTKDNTIGYGNAYSEQQWMDESNSVLTMISVVLGGIAGIVVPPRETEELRRGPAHRGMELRGRRVIGVLHDVREAVVAVAAELGEGQGIVLLGGTGQAVAQGAPVHHTGRMGLVGGSEGRGDETAGDEKAVAAPGYNTSSVAEISYPDVKARGGEDMSLAEQVIPSKLRADVLYRNVYDGVE